MTVLLLVGLGDARSYGLSGEGRISAGVKIRFEGEKIAL